MMFISDKCCGHPDAIATTSCHKCLKPICVQNVMAIGLGATIAAPLAAELVAVYGPAITTALADYVITNQVTTGTVGIILSHPTEANEFAGGLISGYTSAYLDWKTELPPNTFFEATGELVGRAMGVIAARTEEFSAQLNIVYRQNRGYIIGDGQSHPKKQ